MTTLSKIQTKIDTIEYLTSVVIALCEARGRSRSDVNGTLKDILKVCEDCRELTVENQ